MTIHEFGTEYERQREEADRFRKWYEHTIGPIKQANRNEDLGGIDYWGDVLPVRTAIQLKIDFKSDDTNNLFVEWKIEGGGDYPRTVRPGWAQMLHAEEYWFVRPRHQEAICIGKTPLMAWANSAHTNRKPLFGPVYNQNPDTGEKWEAWGYLLPVKLAITMGTLHRPGTHPEAVPPAAGAS